MTTNQYYTSPNCNADLIEPKIQYSSNMVWSRKFAMPKSDTFSLTPVSHLLDKWLSDRMVIVDPFARNSKRGHITNDLNPATSADFHMPADEFVETINILADAVLFDPPYSPRQISECYQQIGMPCSTKDTQNARLYKKVKDGLDKILDVNGIAICFGWNSMGFGVGRGYEMQEILLVSHGAAHNDTIVTVEKKICRIKS